MNIKYVTSNTGKYNVLFLELMLLFRHKDVIIRCSLNHREINLMKHRIQNNTSWVALTTKTRFIYIIAPIITSWKKEHTTGKQILWGWVFFIFRYILNVYNYGGYIKTNNVLYKKCYPTLFFLVLSILS